MSQKYVDPVTDEHLLAIGRVIRMWSSAERLIAHSLWEVSTGFSFADPDEEFISLALVTGMETRTALAMLKAVFGARHPKNSDEFGKIVDKIDKTREKRNMIAHGAWSKGKRPKAISTTHFKSGGSLKAEVHEFTVTELEDLATRIKSRAAEMLKFLESHGYGKTSPHTE